MYNLVILKNKNVKINFYKNQIESINCARRGC